MNQKSIIDEVRAVMPVPTLLLLGRPLSEREARTVAERQAAKLLDLLNIGKPSVEIELLMELPQIEVDIVPGLPWSGRTIWEDGRWHVQINENDSLWRSRATLAHEFKHILDDPYREQLYPGWLRDGRGQPPALPERISEYFAGCVLVPRHWLRRAWEHGIRDSAKLATLFDVSQRMIEVRVQQTGLRGTEKPHGLIGYLRSGAQPAAA
ncbi:ImmA/IrrE family metallo-endopeptidase [Amycolatopsis japonica]|uniref:ImmA/IrrE family metallo-endopeptidase n=1 Tax=Amycolatopsis japonica TaxID=208439 RepID=UPI0033D31D83